MTALAAVESQPLPDKRDFPAGAMIVPCHDLARYHQFTYDLMLLDVPDGTIPIMKRSSSIVQNFNASVQEMLDSEAQWAWIIGDDHGFKRDIVLRLLRHEADIVVPLCVKRGPPFSLVLFDSVWGEDEYGRPLYNTMQFPDLPSDGKLFEVEAAGTAGMLVRRHVFEAIGDPWFENSDGITINEDMVFCIRAREAGFKIMVDPTAVITHLGMLSAYPEQHDGTWGLTLDLQGAAVHLPNGIKLDAPEGDFKKGHVR